MMGFKMKNRYSNGFTLVEIIVTIVAAGILGAIFVNFMGTALESSWNSVEIARDESGVEFLMEQIELREQVESCRSRGPEACDEIESQLQRRGTGLAADFAAELENGDHAAAINSSLKMQFIQRIQQQLGEIRFELEDS